MTSARVSTAVSLVAGLAAALTAMSAIAAPPGAEPGFTLVPYGWLAGLDGTLGAPGDGSVGIPGRVDVSVDPEYDLVGFMFYGEWRGKRWMGFFDSVWANYRQDARVSFGQLLPGSDVSGELDGNIYTLAAGYRVRDWQDASLTLFGGLRYYNLETTVSARGGLLPVPLTTSGDDAWTDAIAGARWTYRLGSAWQGFVQGDVGAGDSDLTWQVFANLGYRFSWGRIIGGYRYLAVDYDTPGFRMDVTLSGPAVGVAFDF